jgi:phosphohistidine phosphatase SixA
MIRDGRTADAGAEDVVMKSLELRRHAQRDPDEDRLSSAGRIEAEDVGRTLERGYAAVFVSPARRAAETAAWMLRGAGEALPPHDVVPGLAGRDPGDPTPHGMAATVRQLLDRLPTGSRALAIGHTPLIEHAAEGLTGRTIEPLAPCEGILVRKGDDEVTVEELRLP